MEERRLKKIKKALGKNFISSLYRSLWFLSDKSYLKLIYRLRMGIKLNLDNPASFTEKLQWLKLYDHNPLYTKLADKHSVRKYIEEKVGEEHLVPLLGVYNSFSEIDFSSLPSSFVIKPTNDSGSCVICYNKALFDLKKARKIINYSLCHNYYHKTREWQYKDIKPQVLVEEYLGKDGPINDYKFFCFNGKAKFMYIEKESSSSPSQAIYDMDFNRLPFSMDDDISSTKYTRPECFNQMRAIAETLSQSIPFLRVDMYYERGKVYVGELTFYHYGGFIPFKPPVWDKKIGEWLNIDSIKGENR